MSISMEKVREKNCGRKKKKWNDQETNKRYLNSPVIKLWKIKQWIGIFHNIAKRQNNWPALADVQVSGHSHVLLGSSKCWANLQHSWRAIWQRPWKTFVKWSQLLISNSTFRKWPKEITRSMCKVATSSSHVMAPCVLIRHSSLL